MNDITFFFVREGYCGTQALRRFCPGGSGRYGNIVSVDDMNEADYMVIIGAPHFGIDYSKFPPERIIYYKAEPDEFLFVQHYWDNVDPKSHKIPMDLNHPRFAIWDINKTYDELIRSEFPVKTKKLTWITTDYGAGREAPEIQVLSGHRLRMQFLQNFLNRYPHEMDLWGYRLEHYNIPCYRGKLYDKFEGLRDYRYTFAFMNSSQPGFYDEKLVDAIMAGCYPLFFGDSNLENIIPEGSFARLKISSKQAPEEAMEIVNSNIREEHLKDLYEAKRILLTKYSLWPRLFCDLNEIAKEEK